MKGVEQWVVASEAPASGTVVPALESESVVMARAPARTVYAQGNISHPHRKLQSTGLDSCTKRRNAGAESPTGNLAF